MAVPVAGMLRCSTKRGSCWTRPALRSRASQRRSDRPGRATPSGSVTGGSREVSIGPSGPRRAVTGLPSTYSVFSLPGARLDPPNVFQGGPLALHRDLRGHIDRLHRRLGVADAGCRHPLEMEAVRRSVVAPETASSPGSVGSRAPVVSFPWTAMSPGRVTVHEGQRRRGGSSPAGERDERD